MDQWIVFQIIAETTVSKGTGESEVTMTVVAEKIHRVTIGVDKAALTGEKISTTGTQEAGKILLVITEAGRAVQTGGTGTLETEELVTEGKKVVGVAEDVVVKVKMIEKFRDFLKRPTGA